MDESKIKKIELDIQDLISLRNNYNLLVVTITGGLISLFFNEITLYKIILCAVGIPLDILFLISARDCSRSIYYKKKEL